TFVVISTATWLLVLLNWLKLLQQAIVLFFHRKKNRLPCTMLKESSQIHTAVLVMHHDLILLYRILRITKIILHEPCFNVVLQRTPPLKRVYQQNYERISWLMPNL
ncbi:hypothetical protein NECAME_03643, partial [Necator americanus]